MAKSLLVASNNASSSAQNSESANQRIIIASGSFGGGTLTLQHSVDGTVWVTSGLTLTAAGKIEFREQPGLIWRVTLAGATAGSVTVDYI